MDVRKYEIYFECSPGYPTSERNEGVRYPYQHQKKISYFQASMYYSVYYIKKCFITLGVIKHSLKIALNHNAESAIIVTCEIAINNLTSEIIIFISGRKFYKTLYFI